MRVWRYWLPTARSRLRFEFLETCVAAPREGPSQHDQKPWSRGAGSGRALQEIQLERFGVCVRVVSPADAARRILRRAGVMRVSVTVG